MKILILFFFNGIEFIDNPALCEPYKNYDRRCLFAHWSPCEYLTIKDNFYFDQIENAYNRVQNYSVENIFQYMKTNDESLITWRSQYV